MISFGITECEVLFSYVFWQKSSRLTECEDKLLDCVDTSQHYQVC
jgi:hypothetical protein